MNEMKKKKLLLVSESRSPSFVSLAYYIDEKLLLSYDILQQNNPFNRLA